jgi:hypothetical protein
MFLCFIDMHTSILYALCTTPLDTTHLRLRLCARSLIHCQLRTAAPLAPSEPNICESDTLHFSQTCYLLFLSPLPLSATEVNRRHHWRNRTWPPCQA